MTYKLIILLLGLSIQANAQNSNRFSDKVNLKRFTKEYVKTKKYNTNGEFSKANIEKIVEKYASKYRVDTIVNDTIFILETCILESQRCFGSLWSQQKKIDYLMPYTYNRKLNAIASNPKKLKFSNHRAFNEEEREALSKWDKSFFNSLNEKGGRWISPDWHHATRIIIGDGDICAERIKYLY
jgi:hypothetical protein